MKEKATIGYLGVLEGGITDCSIGLKSMWILHMCQSRDSKVREQGLLAHDCSRDNGLQISYDDNFFYPQSAARCECNYSWGREYRVPSSMNIMR